ncbi:sugar transferase [Enterococcus faecium]|uniref:sugar transferase n=1 Tax=Enterococcus TaxID=1350 RepID=UPI0009BE9FF5|nr:MULTISPECIES: sugar transferase [Enterococcus]EGP4970774.1 sugar transferase [Enterococcus faecium]EGP5456722.1 sugar transferase [Enterococcus faecium]EGP5554225.1 sugar transferase [Enterococcus faecium]MBX4243244.1 sugar transferase [Enterococcus lactis]MBX4247722.1 sugar transferase [Enterococcus lactis]
MKSKTRFYQKYVKRIVDIVISFVLLIGLSPLFIIIILFVKFTSKGPVFFVQERIGRDGKIFLIFKFRTMCVGAENMGSGLTVKSDSDSRITPIGNVLRKTSLDEIPQLLNILKGDMSLIGPRPPVTYFPYDGYYNYPEWAKKRFSIRPGVTGLAQCSVRNSVPWDRRIEIDLTYIESISFFNDVKIFFLTILRVIRTSNVYDEGKIERNE